MAFIFNAFSALEEPDSPTSAPVTAEAETVIGGSSSDMLTPVKGSTELVVPSSPKKATGTRSVGDAATAPVRTRLFATSWADAEDEDPIDEFPPLAKTEVNTSFVKPLTGAAHAAPREATAAQPKVDMSEAEKQAWKAFDLALSKKRSLEVTHAVRVYNKETKEVSTAKNTRTFRVVSKSAYDSLRRLIGKFRTHTGDKVNFREQADKIKMANSLMEICFKDPKQPCCFIYPVVIIHLESGKTLTRNEIHKGSRCLFDVSDITFYPSYEQK